MLVEHAQRQDEDEQIAAAARVCAYILSFMVSSLL